MFVRERLVIENKRIEELIKSFVLRSLAAEIDFYTSLLSQSQSEALTKEMRGAQQIIMGLKELLLNRGYSDKEIKTAIRIFQARKRLQDTNSSTIIQG